MKPHYLAVSKNRELIPDLCMAMALDLGEEVFGSAPRMLAGRADQTATLARVDVPTLILFGAEDQLCPLERHHAMADLIARAKLVRIENAGHLPCSSSLTKQQQHCNAGWRNDERSRWRFCAD